MQKSPFSKADIEQLKTHEITKMEVYEQLKTFRQGIPYINILAPAILDDGITQLSNAQKEKLIDLYNSTTCETIKFVPASGSATRMFKLIHQFLNQFNPQKNQLEDFLEEEFLPLQKFYHQLQDLPFYSLVKAEMQTKYPDKIALNPAEEFYNFISFMIREMNYAELPKGLIPFHHYEHKTATAFEEHLYEAAQYLTPKNGIIKLHFTIGKNQLKRFKDTFKNIKTRLEKETKLKFDIAYSYQEKSTDTLAVNKNNQPFRMPDGKLLLRPGGHGALIQNLNNIEADIIFIKNIDNIVTEDYTPVITAYKKALGGLLLKVQHHIFELLQCLDEKGFSKTLQQKAEELSLAFFHQKKSFKSKDEIKKYFNRPLRVCGMVENKGEPGGGPFWVDNHGYKSLQIVEKAQINDRDEAQINIQQQSTHFNPVDIVCGIRDYQGEKFDLQNYINPNQGFIVNKSLEGKSLKALELPGLWNGAMAYWNTIFVEVPLETFNPVKTVVDLLKPAHQVAYSK